MVIIVLLIMSSKGSIETTLSSDLRDVSTLPPRQPTEGAARKRKYVGRIGRVVIQKNARSPTTGS